MTPAPAGAPATPPAVRAASCPAEELPQVVHGLLVDLLSTFTAVSAVSATLVTVSSGRGSRAHLRSWATSGPAGADLDALQAAAGQGPSFLAAERPEVVAAGDVFSDPRWRLVAPDHALPAVSVLSAALPGWARDRVVLTVHGTGPDLVAPSVVEQVAFVLPELAAGVAVVQSRLEVDHLRRALANNRVIGAAVGVTMASRRLTYEAAGDLLHLLSNRTNVRMADLAEDILLTGEVPEAPHQRIPRARRPVPPV